MRVQVYVCPSCGGKVEFDKEEKMWNCLYCKKKYKALFSYDYEYDTPDLILQEQNYYSFHCNKCNKYYIDTKKEAECIHCNAKNKSNKSFPLTSFSNSDPNTQLSNNYFNRELKKSCPASLLSEYKNTPFENKYIECVTLNGFIELSYKNHKKRYVFINILLPNTDFEDYRFFYELANNGFNYKTLIKGSHSNIIEKVNEKDSLIKQLTEQDNISFDDKKIEEEITNNCIESFKYNYKIKETKDIEIKKDFKFMRGNYIPIILKNIEIDGEIYRQYYIDYNAIDLRTDNPFLFEYPTTPKKTRGLRRCAALNSISEVILVISLLLLFPITITSSTILTSEMLFTYIFFLISSTLTFLLTLKEKTRLQYIKKISRDEYINEIIHNSNYVKEIEV